MLPWPLSHSGSDSEPRAAAPSHPCLSFPTWDRSFEGQVGRCSWGQLLPPCSHAPWPSLATELLETRRPLAHECLGEALRVMRQVISKYQLLNTVETLTAAGTLIAKVKGQLAKTGPQGLEGFLEEGMGA